MSKSLHNQLTVVLGSGRSGTSVITKALQSLGCYLGDNLIPPNSTNPKGFFEDNAIVYEVSEKIISRLGTQWNSVMPFDFSKDVDLSDIEEIAEKILLQKFEQSSWCGFKDPRTSRLLHFWQPLFQKMSVNDNYIFALRNPLSSVASFIRYEDVSSYKGFLIWLALVIPAIDNILDRKVLFVSYEEMLSSPEQQLQRLHKQLDCSIPLNEDAIIEYSKNFIDMDLLRNKFSYEDFKAAPELPKLCLKIYDLLNAVALDQLEFHSNTFKTEWHEIYNTYFESIENFSSLYRLMDSDPVKEISRQQPLLSEKDSLLSEKDRLLSEKEKIIEGILSSYSWRLTKPLRYLSSFLPKKKLL
jgi:hypothetical protein